MDVRKIDQIIEEYRPLSLFSSYPVATVDDTGACIIVWFNFSIPEEGDEEVADVRITATEAFCMDAEYNVETRPFEVDETVRYEMTEDPEYEYDQYLSSLGEIIENYDQEKMRYLLLNTEQFFITDIAFRACETFK